MDLRVTVRDSWSEASGCPSCLLSMATEGKKLHGAGHSTLLLNGSHSLPCAMGPREEGPWPQGRDMPGLAAQASSASGWPATTVLTAQLRGWYADDRSSGGTVPQGVRARLLASWL